MSWFFLTVWLRAAKKKAVQSFTRTENEIIDMHFILLVYKYEYIMNKISSFIEMAAVCGCFVLVREYARAFTEYN